jgi:hypothetical protein
MRRLDTALLQLAEAFAHFTQEWLGLTSFFWCRVSCGVESVGAMILFLGYWFPQLSRFTSASWFQLLFGFNILVLSGQVGRLRRIEDAWSRNPTALPAELVAMRVTRNFLIRQVTVAAFAISVLTVFVHLHAQELAHIALFGGSAAHNYFISVNPKPPAESRLRQWLDAPFLQLVPSRGRS